MLIGINEIRSMDFTAWTDEYRAVIQEVKEEHPGVNIYLILNYHPLEVSGLTDEELNEHLQMENDGLISIAREEHVYYLNPDEALASNGKVREDIVWDGLHLNTEGSQIFADFIATHVVREDVYVKEICE
jgi:lysophospholipase L1-like esterase